MHDACKRSHQHTYAARGPIAHTVCRQAPHNQMQVHMTCVRTYLVEDPNFPVGCGFGNTVSVVVEHETVRLQGEVTDRGGQIEDCNLLPPHCMRVPLSAHTVCNLTQHTCKSRPILLQATVEVGVSSSVPKVGSCVSVTKPIGMHMLCLYHT